MVPSATRATVTCISPTRWWAMVPSTWSTPPASGPTSTSCGRSRGGPDTSRGSFSRLILFDMRGVGLSDRGPEPPVVEVQMADIGAVMDAAGSQAAAVFGGARGAAPALLFAASHPERTRALVLYAPFVRTLEAPDFPWGWTEERWRESYERFVTETGTGEDLERLGPDAAHDDRFKQWWARFERLVASPQQVRELAEILGQIDIRSVLPHIQVPTLVLHRTGDRISDVGQGRYVAESIPGARFVELPGADHLPFLGDRGALLDEIQEFLTGVRPAPETDRVLATVLFTDMVASTELAARLGDRRWSDLLVEPTPPSANSSTGFGAERSILRETASWPRLTGRPVLSAARSPSPRGCARWASRSGPVCTPGNARSSERASPGSLCTSLRASAAWRSPARCSPRGRSASSWQARSEEH